ncbi:protein of unknown function [Sanguibacter gelidistatuariae]|uniref:DUF1905 domain-containing protein n=1 Tax=Sanguibacter gelidistatuariae TaxID=1814289 RepID=A0A1G6Q6M8_9MICO|nr:DUF1905 domain-containing protein [Sanguibacter gelidistatuariae]SDC87297.1 protein of unknown function [Sanguibacter gelidistatuariae]
MAMLDDPLTLDHEFTAQLQKDGAFDTYLTVPGSVELLGTRKAVKVTGTVDGHHFAATLMPSGSGLHRLPLRAALRKAVGKDAAGDEVRIRLEKRLG